MNQVLGRGRWVSLIVGLLATVMLGSMLAPAQAAERAVVERNEFGKIRSVVKGEFGRNGTVRGTFEPRRFLENNRGQLVAAGKLTLTAVRGNGKVVGTESKRQRFVVPVINGNLVGTPAAAGAAGAARAAECDVLNLVLGPLDLNLLGLQISLNRVVLDIVAVTGAGNLLGNLLCAVAGLLDAGVPGLLGEIANILNAILAILRL
jgi:hypothetical protein